MVSVLVSFGYIQPRPDAAEQSTPPQARTPPPLLEPPNEHVESALGQPRGGALRRCPQPLNVAVIALIIRTLLPHSRVMSSTSDVRMATGPGWRRAASATVASIAYLCPCRPAPLGSRAAALAAASVIGSTLTRESAHCSRGRSTRLHSSNALSAADFVELPNAEWRKRAARTCVLARELAEDLVHGTETDLRSATAQNPNLDTDLVALLGRDPDPDVRRLVSVRPDLTEAERSRIDIEFDPSARCYPLSWVRDLEDDEEAMRRCATSAHVMLRRSAAWAKNLPADVVDLLAHDEDWVVRLFLAENCAQAPADVLLEMAQDWDGYSAPRIIEHPNFPRQGTLRFADDPNPNARRLALLDPKSTAELVERLSRDADPGIRRRALRDQRLSAASVIRMLDDPHQGIRDAAAADPRLPTHVLTSLLRDTATAAHAAANPAIPETVMHDLLDR